MIAIEILYYIIIISVVSFVDSFQLLSHNKRYIHPNRCVIKPCHNIKIIKPSQSSLHLSSLSLDVSPIPRIKYNLNLIILPIIVILVAFLVRFSSEFNPMQPWIESFTDWFQNDLLPSLQLNLRIFKAKMALEVENIKQNICNYFNKSNMQEINLDNWNLCTLQERELLRGDFIRYRLKMSDSNSVLPLFAGQEVFLLTFSFSFLSNLFSFSFCCAPLMELIES